MADACCLLCPVLGRLSPLSLHGLRGDELRESSESCSLLRSTGLPEFRLEKHERIVGPAHGQMVLVISPLTFLAVSRSRSRGRGLGGQCSS